ncbi:MAG: hypothetical protein R2849_08930 [Thermomicrobiales bacterium]
MAAAVDSEIKEIADAANLRYVSDDEPGFTRRRAGRGFSYKHPDGSTVRDSAIRERIEELAIPPAWTDVWICRTDSGHIQATGRDDRDRKQYIYHERWRELRDAHKYDNLVIFAESLPAIRERTDHDLRKHGLPREKLLAGVVRLLEATLIRIGNQEYAKVNKSFGLTTLRAKHVEVEGTRIHFHFNGKGGKEHDIELADRRLARLVERCVEIPGYEIFRYLDEDETPHTIESADVNAYLRDITGEDLTAKDFRTWGGTLLGAEELASKPAPETEKEAAATINEAIKIVAARLGNTPTICRKCYVHPGILDAYQDGALQKAFSKSSNGSSARNEYALTANELATLSIVRDRPAIDLTGSC